MTANTTNDAATTGSGLLPQADMSGLGPYYGVPGYAHIGSASPVQAVQGTVDSVSSAIQTVMQTVVSNNSLTSSPVNTIASLINAVQSAAEAAGSAGAANGAGASIAHVGALQGVGDALSSTIGNTVADLLTQHSVTTVI